MVAPKARSIFDRAREHVGVQLVCPECPNLTLERWLRVETVGDWPQGKAPDIVNNSGPLGFVLRCDSCGFRVHMKGDRLPTVDMMEQALAEDRSKPLWPDGNR